MKIIRKTGGNWETKVIVTPSGVLVSRPFLAFEKESLEFSDGSCWEIIFILIIQQFHTFASNIMFEQRRFDLGCPSFYLIKWQEENEKQPIYSYFSLLPERTGISTW